MDAGYCQSRAVRRGAQLARGLAVEAGQLDLAIADPRNSGEGGVDVGPGFIAQRIDLQTDRLADPLEEARVAGSHRRAAFD